MNAPRRIAVALFTVVCAAATANAQDAGTADLRQYVQKLESRIAELERDREWPLDSARMQSASALEAAVKSVNITGYIEFLCSYNLRHGGEQDARRGDTLNFNQLRGPDADESSFSFENVELLVDKPLTTVGSTGFHIRLSYGITGTIGHADPNFDEAGAFDVREAFFSWRAPFEPTGHIDVSIGRYRTPLGFETIENTDNWIVTRNPIALFATPVTHTGVRVSVPLCEVAVANLYLVNGWDEIRDGNDGKTGVANIVLGRFDTLQSQIQLNGSWGALEGVETHQGDKRGFAEIIWDGKFTETTEFAVDAVVGRIPRRSWHGAAGYIRHHATQTLWFSGRAGWYADDALGTGGGRLVDGSLAIGCDVAKDLTIAVEHRHDFSASEDLFLDSSGDPTDSQDTLTASFLFRF